MSATNYQTISNVHIDSLANYVQDVKPYHTKLNAIVEKYLFDDTVNVKMTEAEKLLAFFGADLMPAVAIPGEGRARRSNTWYRDFISDGLRSTWTVPLTSIPKFLSHAGQQNFVAGTDDDTQIPGLVAPARAFNQRRWDGPSITDVRKNGVHQQESLDYFLSHGINSFDITTSGRWKQHDVSGVMSLTEQDGTLLYQDNVQAFGTIKNITGGNYEEWTLTCTSPGVLEVKGSVSGVIGSATFQVPFVSPQISFLFDVAPGETSDTSSPLDDAFTPPAPDVFVLTPLNKITVNPTAPLETWSLIKTNPIVVNGKPTFTPAVPRADSPALEIHTRSLDATIEPSTWSLIFTSATAYTLQRSVPIGFPDQGSTIFYGDLANGNSYKDSNIHFTIIPGTVAFNVGDTFNWTINQRVENYLVFGSVSGFQPNAKIGEWYYNGKIGFKIPALTYFAKAYNTTVAVSPAALANTWTTSVSNNQVLTNVTFVNNLFYSVGAGNIVGVSADGKSWSSDLSVGFTPNPTGNLFFMIVGEGGNVITSVDGITWVQQLSATPYQLNSATYIPNFLSANSFSPPSLSCIVAVGNNGTIQTSIGELMVQRLVDGVPTWQVSNGPGWSVQNSGTTANLNDITWSNDAIIVVGNGGTILRSLDRVTWTPIPSATSVNLHAIIYDPIANAFIVVGDGGTILRSVDGGLTWNNLNAFSSGSFTSITYGEGKFVVVGPDGWVAQSFDGIIWTRYASKGFNAVAFGNGVFVAVGGKSNEIEQFVPVSGPSSMAVPSVYTVTFTSPTTATVNNNVYGYRAGLIPDQVWSDEFSSFILSTAGGSFDYVAGDTFQIFMAPSETFTALGWYDEHPYDSLLYDTEASQVTVPWLYDAEIFPLYYGHGLVVFKSGTATGDAFVIDKALYDYVKMQIVGASSVFPELGADSDWLPLEFRYNANFSDLTTAITAYSGADPNKLVFTITQPRYASSNQNASATITFDPTFFANYLAFNTRYSLMFVPDELYGQTLRVKMTENLKIAASINLILSDITLVSIVDSQISAIEIVEDIAFYEGPNIGYWRVEEDKTYEFIQSSLVTVWNITHNLDTSNMTVTVFDSLGNVIHPLSIQFPTNNSVIITLANASIGKAELRKLILQNTTLTGFDYYSVNLANTSSLTFESHAPFPGATTWLDYQNILPFTVSFAEGGALPGPVPDGYDSYPYDIYAYDTRISNGVLGGVVEISPGVYDYTGNPSDWIMPSPTALVPSNEITETPNPDIAGASMNDGLTIAEYAAPGGIPSGTINQLSVYYDFQQHPSPSGPGNPPISTGLLIEVAADQYLITHNGSVGPSPNVFVESQPSLTPDSNRIIGLVIPTPYSFPQVTGSISLQGFTFSLPPGFMAPFKLWIV